MKGRFQRKVRQQGGWVFIGVLVLVVVLCTVALAMAPAWTRYYGVKERQLERSALAVIESSFKSHVTDSGTIPAATNLIPVILNRAGKSLNQGLFNRQGKSRVILVDPEFGVGAAGNEALPFNQGQGGTSAKRGARLLVISSLGQTLPNHLVSGAALTSAQFSNIWNAAQGQVPAGWNWQGNPDDLCIQRVHLGELFVTVTLRYHSDQPAHRGLYSIGSEPGTTNAATLLPANPFTAQFLRSTYLSLFGTNGALQFRDVLQEDGMVYTCQNGIWRQGEGTRGSRLGPVIRHPTPEEFADAIDAFMDSQVALWPENTSSTKADMFRAITNFLAVGAYNNQSGAMSAAQNVLIDRWVDFTGANPNKP